MKKSCPTRRGSKEEVEENESEDVSSARWGETIAALDMHVKKRRHTGGSSRTNSRQNRMSGCGICMSRGRVRGVSETYV